jgi:hypothetical protein
MKIDTQVNGQKVTIELTEKQLIEIQKQTCKRTDFKQITSVRKACEVTGDDYDELMEACCGLPKDEAAFKQLKVVRKAINPVGYKPNWDNYSEYKYFPYFNMKGVFSYSATYDWHTTTRVPSALSSVDSNRAEHFGKTFIDLFKDLMTE